jgi:hypothetical protein
MRNAGGGPVHAIDIANEQGYRYTTSNGIVYLL